MKQKLIWEAFLLLPVLLICFLCGCSTVVNSHRQKASMMDAYTAGKYDETLSVINRKLKSAEGTGDELMWHLESGSMNFTMGNYDESIRSLERAENLVSEYDERALVSLRDVSSEGAMAVTNLNALPYRGFCRDRILIPVFKALAYLGRGDEEGFRVEIFRLRDAQQKVMDDYRKFFEAEEAAAAEAGNQNADVAAKVSESKDAPTQNEEFNTELAQVTEVANRGYGNFLNPLAIYLSGIGFARDNNYENAIVDFERLYKALPNHPLIRSSYVAVLQRTGREIPEELKSVKALEHPLDQNSLLVIFANGRSAAFKQIAVYFPVMTAWPICEYYDAPYRTLGVETDGVKNETVPLADMDGILSQEYKERLTAMIIRITISTTLKEAASYGAAYAAWRANPIVGVAVFLSSVVYRATFNTADTRSWEILPKEFQIAQLPMPENRELKLTLSPNGSSLPLETTLLLPDTCRSAILYVDAPGPGVWNCKVLELKAK